MSKQAVTYVQRLGFTDQHAEQVFLLCRAHRDHEQPVGRRDPRDHGSRGRPADIPALAARVGLDPEGFHAQLRGLKQHVRMDGPGA